MSRQEAVVEKVLVPTDPLVKVHPTSLYVTLICPPPALGWPVAVILQFTTSMVRWYQVLVAMGVGSCAVPSTVHP